MILANIFSIWFSMLMAITPFSSETYQISPQSSISVNGTSTLHDWTMTMKSVSGKADFILSDENLSVSNLRIELKTENLKSKHTQMDKITYKAMKSKEFPNIIFTSSNLSLSSKKGTIQTIKGAGELTIAGVTKAITLNARCEVDENGTINCRGSKTIKMTDFNIDPPTAMLGTIKTGDEITVVFNTTFSQIDQ